MLLIVTIIAFCAASCGGGGGAAPIPTGTPATPAGKQPVPASSQPGSGALQTAAVTLPPLTDQGGAGQVIDGIACQTSEQLAYHIHAHLALIVDGTLVPIPAGIGIAPPRTLQGNFVAGGRCIYWLHTHDTSGVLHIESPTTTTYTLGQFFAVWGEPITASQIATFSVTDQEPLHIFVDRNPYSGPPDQVPLTPHALITLEIGREAPPPDFQFPPGL